MFYMSLRSLLASFVCLGSATSYIISAILELLWQRLFHDGLTGVPPQTLAWMKVPVP